MLSERYAKHLEKAQNSSLNKDDCRLLVRSSLVEGLNRNFSNSEEHIQQMGLEEMPWDDIDEKSIKIALDEVILYKRMAKLETSKRVGSAYEESSNLSKNAEKYVNAPNFLFHKYLVSITSEIFCLRIQPIYLDCAPFGASF